MSSYFTQSSPLSTCRKLWLLIYKNKSVQFAHPISTIMIIVTPILFFMLPQIETLVKRPGPSDDTERRYPKLTIDAPNVTTIFYSPINHVLDDIVNEVAKEFPKCKVESYLYASDMDIALKVKDAFVGIEFEDHFRNILEIPPKVRVALRFPLHARNLVGSKWTKQLFKLWYSHEDPYKSEGFLYLQRLLFQAIILSENKSAIIPKVDLYPFPEAARITYTEFIKGYSELMLTFFLIYMLPSLIVCMMIVTEKQKNLKDIMQVMGLSNGLNWLSWFIVTFIMFMVPAIVIVILMKSLLCCKSSLIVLLMIFIIYILSLISLIFVVSAVFSNSFLAMIVLCIANIISTIPFMVNFYADLCFVNSLLICTFINSAMPSILYQLLGYELYDVGLQWNNIFRRVHPDDNLSYGTILVIMMFTSIFYMLLFFYMDQLRPGGFRAPKKWYFPFTRQFYCPSRPATDYTVEGSGSSEIRHVRSNLHTLVFQEKWINNVTIINCENLNKTFGLRVVVRNFTLKFYDNEITVLFGHNGAGKTSLFMMMTGIYPPTSGRVLINGQDMAISPKTARQNLCICPQNNIFFEELTAYWHIYFFCRLKGLSRSDSKKETYNYLYKTNMRNVALTKVKKLSTVMRRKLALSCALCAGSKVVLCDEPSAFLDPTESKEVWDLLRAEKDGRCIVINTYNVNVAAVLADRIAIISEGEIIGYGTPEYLISNLGPGYRLVCVRQPDCIIWEVTKFLQRKMREIRFESADSPEIVYRLPMEKQSKFPSLFESLENRLDRLKLISFSVSAPTMDETFLKIGLNRIDEWEDIDIVEQSAWMENIQEVHKLRRYVNRWHGMFFKKKLFTRQNLIPILILMIIPLIVTVVNLFFDILHSDVDPYYIPSFRDLNLYPSAYVVWEGQKPKAEVNTEDEIDDDSKTFASEYDRAAMLTGATVINVKYGVENYLIKHIDLLREGFSRTFVAGASFQGHNVKAWFNRRLMHGKPVAFNLVFNALGNTLANIDIEIYNKPRNSSNVMTITEINQAAAINSIYVMIYLSIVMAMFITLPIQERVTRLKQHQLLSGISFYTYWLSHFIWDFVTFLLMTLSLIVSFYQNSTETLYGLFIFLIVFAFTSLPFIYMSSFLFKDSNIGISVMTLTNIIIVFLATCAYEYKYTSTLQVFHHMFMIIPHYAMYLATRATFIHGNTLEACKELNLPNSKTSCVDLEKERYVSQTEMCCMLISGIVYFLLLFLICRLHYRGFPNRYLRTRCQTVFDDRDVRDLRNQVDKIVKDKEQLKSYTLVCERIAKKYHNRMAINCLSFKIKPFECFCLLGLSGSGKSLIIDLVVGKKKISQGNIYIKGFSMRNNIQKCSSHIGYCPQNNTVLHYMTGREMLKYACLIKGIKKSAINEIIRNLANSFVFTKQLDQMTVYYNSGTKRKLFIAMAVLSPSLICLDDPITGLDICARYQISRVLCRLRSHGKSLLITSNSVSDCEVLCSTLAILVNGRIRCIGSVQHLKNRFNRGLSIHIQVGTKEEMQEIINAKEALRKSFDSDKRNSNRISDGTDSNQVDNNLPVPPTADKGVQAKIKKKRIPKYFERPTTSLRNSNSTNVTLDEDLEQPIGRGTIVSKRRITLGRPIHMPLIHENNFYSLLLDLEDKFSLDFPDSFVTEMYTNRGSVTITIPDRNLRWSEIYQYMEEHRFPMQIKSYTICQTTLEDIFFNFVQNTDDVV